jgi:hypothetical protein
MPRKVHYAARFQFFREAAFAIVRDRGVAALSRRAVAQELAISRNRVDDVLRAEADLRVLAAAVVESRRSAGRFGLSRGEPHEIALRVVCSLLPDAPERVDEELVWFRLMIEGPRHSAPIPDPDGPLWAQYQIADRGYVHSVPDSAARPSDQEGQPRADPLAELRSDREQLVTGRITQALGELGLRGEAAEREAARVRAMVDGLTWAVCLGRVTPDQAVQVVREHLGSLAPRDGRRGAVA